MGNCYESWNGDGRKWNVIRTVGRLAMFFMVDFIRVHYLVYFVLALMSLDVLIFFYVGHGCSLFH